MAIELDTIAAGINAENTKPLFLLGDNSFIHQIIYISDNAGMFQTIFKNILAVQYVININQTGKDYLFVYIK